MKNDLARDKAIEKWVAGKLRAQAGAAGPDCLDAETVAAYVERTLAPTERVFLESHLASCLACQERVAELVRWSEADEPAEVRVEAGMRQEARLSWFRWAWAGPVIVAVIISGLWYTAEFRPLLRMREKALPETARPAASAPQQEAETPQAREAPREEHREKHETALPGSKRTRDAAQVPGLAITSGETDKLAGRATAAAPAAALPVVPGVSPGLAGGAIATPSERAKVAGGGGGIRAGEDVGVGSATTSVAGAREDREAARAEAPVPPSKPGLKVEEEPTKETGSVAANERMKDITSEAKVLGVMPISEAQGEKHQKTAPSGLRATGASFAGPLLQVKSPGGGEWRVGPRGLIQKTDVEGHWVTVPSGVESDLYDIKFPTSKIGWAVGQAGTVLWTTDGGATWSKVSLPTDEDLNQVSAADDLSARVLTRSGRAFATADGGKTWIPVPRD